MNLDVQVSVEKVWPGFVCYWTGRDSDARLHRFVWQAPPQSPRVGEVWKVRGEIKIHPEFGPQCHVESGEWCQPSGRLLVEFLARHEAFKGVGVGIARASALYARFGEELYGILDAGDAERLAQVEKLPREAIQPLLQAWQAAMEETEVIRWLARYEVPLRLATKLLNVYGAETVQKLEENPYRLLAFLPFSRSDKLALRMGLKPDDPRRQVAVVQHCLYQQLEHGHTVTPVDELAEKARPYLPDRTTRAALDAIKSGKEAKAIVITGSGASTTGIRLLEMDAISRFQRLLEVRDTAQLDLGPEIIGAGADQALDAFERETGFPLNPAQKTAVEMALGEPLSILSGGAGVGKTTVLRAICMALRSSVYLMALTGQAAKRMMEATGHPATTIEMFLRKIAQELHRSSRPLLIVDEASMLDLPLTVRLLRAMPETARLLLVGDPAQLPPIGFGLIFHRLAESPALPHTQLTIINRQTEASGIPEISRLIRDGKVPVIPDYRGAVPGVSFMACLRGEIMQRLVDLKATSPGAQILCIKNTGGAGVDDVNEVFHRIHQVGRKSVPELRLAVGDPVIFKKNLGALNLVNGSLGTVSDFSRRDGYSDTDQNGWAVECNFSGEAKQLEDTFLQHLRLAYAITVHASQGSQFERVFVVVEKSQLLDRTLVYTALTRGVQQVVFVGDRTAFAQAVVAPPRAAHRMVHFKI